MRSSFLPAAVAVWAIAAASASAATASQTFKDVPGGHWAEAAVTQVAVDRAFMQGYADGTFRGTQPFTRLQLAMSVNELIKELEKITKVSWAAPGLGGFAFKDLPADPKQRAIVLKLANEYRLFDGVPGVTSQTLETDKQVTRYEMAKVVDRLMHLGEARGVVDPSLLTSQVRALSDLPPSAWDYNEVREVADRYQVMVGFPDGTFRGPEQLTRYQFAASAAQTFPSVRALVEKTQENLNKPPAVATPRAAAKRFLEDTPFQLGVAGRFNGPVGPVAAARALGYFNSPLFLMGDTRLNDTTTSNDRLYGAHLDLGYAFDAVGIVSLQPYLGARLVSDVTTTLGGLNYGLIAYGRPMEKLGLYGQANGTSALGATQGTVLGSFIGNGALGLEYYFTPKLALGLEANYDMLPSTLNTPASPFATDGALSGKIQLNFGF